MDINGQVIMSLDAYDKLQNELAEAKAEVEKLRDEFAGIRVFELVNAYSGAKNLAYTEFAQRQFAELVKSNPQFVFRDLDEIAVWSVAKVVGEDA